MKNGLLISIALLGFPFLFAYRPSLAARLAVDLEAVEAAVRNADADWAAAANRASVDAWMAFYAPDAVLFLPNDRLGSDKELLRESLSSLLALPHLSVTWSPIKVEVARSGEHALVTETYELHFSDSRGAPVVDRGRRLAIWSKQADGTWKCTVDTWNLDQANAVPPTASPASAQVASSTASSAALFANPSAAPLVEAADSGAPPAAVGANAKFGEKPVHYEETIRQYFLEHLKYPDSIQYRETGGPEQGYTSSVTGTFLMRDTRTYGWTVKATINAKNSRDSYVGFKTYTFLFRGEKIVDIRLPLPGDEMSEPARH
jgi:ketosteroid isomerase-like protein